MMTSQQPAIKCQPSASSMAINRVDKGQQVVANRQPTRLTASLTKRLSIRQSNRQTDRQTFGLDNMCNDAYIVQKKNRKKTTVATTMARHNEHNYWPSKSNATRYQRFESVTLIAANSSSQAAKKMIINYSSGGRKKY